MAMNYESAYQQALARNQQMYDTILQGYTSLAAQQAAAQQPILSGYQQLTNAVLNDLQGVEKSQATAIKDYYTGVAGKQDQSAINRGLANTTVRNALQRGTALDRAKAETDLANKMASTRADVRGRLTSQALGYQALMNQQNTALGLDKLRWQNSVSAPYPNAAEYMRLAQMQGQNRQGLRGSSAVPGLGGGSFRSSGVPQSSRVQGPQMTPINYGVGQMVRADTGYGGGYGSAGLRSSAAGQAFLNNKNAGVFSATLDMSGGSTNYGLTGSALDNELTNYNLYGMNTYGEYNDAYDFLGANQNYDLYGYSPSGYYDQTYDFLGENQSYDLYGYSPSGYYDAASDFLGEGQSFDLYGYSASGYYDAASDFLGEGQSFDSSGYSPSGWYDPAYDTGAASGGAYQDASSFFSY